MVRSIYVVLSVCSLLGFADCTAEVRPETPHEARAANRMGVRTRRDLLLHPALQEVRAEGDPDN